MLMMIGTVAFEVSPLNAHSIDHTAEASWAEKPIVGAAPALEFVGEGAASWTINGRLFPEKLGGLPGLEDLHAMRRSGKPQFMVRGDGKVFGWVAITDIRETATYLNARGVGRQVDFTLSARRCSSPSKGSYFSVLAGLV